MRAVIYVHIHDQNNPAQGFVRVDNLQTYADRKRIEVIRVFTENINDEKDLFQLLNRPILNKCISFCCQEHPDLLLVSRLSDLGPFTHDIIRAVDTLSNNGVSIYIQDIDVVTFKKDGTPDPSGTLMMKVLKEACSIDYEYYCARRYAGRERYKNAGGRLGRPKGTGMTPEQILEKYPGVSSRLDEDEDATLDEIAAEEGVSRSTVKKVKKAKMVWLQLGERMKKDSLIYNEAAENMHNDVSNEEDDDEKEH